MIGPTGYSGAAAELGADASADESSATEAGVVSPTAASSIGHVLVGIDGSAESVVAFRWAERFAAATGRRLHLAHAWQHVRGRREFLTTPMGGDVSSLEADVVARLRQFTAEQAGRPALVTECWALRGDVAGAMRKQAAQSGADMIVVGARGTGGALRAVLGSAARQLTECPSRVIAVVPEHPLQPEGGGTIVVGVDGSAGSSRALRWAGATAKESGAEVVVIHAFEPPESDLTPTEQSSALDEAKLRLEGEWCAPLRDLGVRYRAVVEAGAARFVIQRTADAVQPVCVVVGSRGLGALSQRLLGSVTYYLVRRLDWPTVIVPSPRDCIVWSG